jgi:CheY-like chemotaxis protein
MQTLNQQPRRILVIDDNDAIHADFRKILGTSNDAGASKLAGAKAALFGDEPAASAPAKMNFLIDSALQGQEGFAKLQAAVNEKKPYSVAFVDMRMPPAGMACRPFKNYGMSIPICRSSSVRLIPTIRGTRFPASSA